jgi:menaquinone-dependent protoporphyrinogen IX oxidase
LFGRAPANTESEALNVLPRLRVMLSGDLMDAEGIYQRSKNVAERPDEIDLDSFSFALVAASVHAGAHEREVIRFIKKHRDQLERMRTAFISVTLSEAGAEPVDAMPAEHVRFAADVKRVIESSQRQVQ